MAGAINNPAASPPPTKKLKTAEDSSIERISAFAVDTQHQIQGLRQMLLDLEAVMKRQITLLSERAGLALEKQADVVNSFVSEAEKIKKQVDSQNAVLQQLDRASTASRAVLDGAVRDTMTKLNASPAEVSSLFPSNAMDVDVAPFEGLQRAAGAHFSSSSSDQRSYEGSAVASGGPLFVTAPPSVDAVSNAGFAPAQWSFVPVPSAAVKSSLDLVLPSATSPTIVDSASPSQSSGNKSILDRLSMPLESGRRAEKPASSSSSQDRRARSHSRERSSSRRDPSPSGGDRRRRDHSAERKPASKSNSSGTADPPKKDAPQPVLVDGPRPRPTDNPNERFGGKSLRTPSRTLWIGSVPYKARKQWMECVLILPIHHPFVCLFVYPETNEGSFFSYFSLERLWTETDFVWNHTKLEMAMPLSTFVPFRIANEHSHTFATIQTTLSTSNRDNPHLVHLPCSKNKTKQKPSPSPSFFICDFDGARSNSVVD
jgi:hypothetical protein